MVAAAFVPNPYNYKEVNHKDGNRFNNAAENLEWCDRKANCIHGLDNNLMAHGEKSCKAKITEEEMFEIKRLYNETELSQEAIGKIFGISQSQVGNIVRGESWRRIQAR